ncbi:hypothetical protein SDC9_80773 [bioreactor metagenome]|uniref:Uncharacterized protein n=1 Tax=bioreactor metagenome TaxID=1076179 RepID=A0A644Z2E7_9ZZZZ
MFAEIQLLNESFVELKNTINVKEIDPYFNAKCSVDVIWSMLSPDVKPCP